MTGMLPGRDYTHVVMTRFNLPTPGKESRIRSRPGWLEGRGDLFERYCLPSIAAQTANATETGTAPRRFGWMVFFDVETPPAFRERIEGWREVFPFTAYFTPHFEAEGWPRSLRETFGGTPAQGPTPWLLTTRFDSDDALSQDHVARLQATLATRAPERASWNLTQGFVLADGRVYAHEHRSNAFASWLEPWDASARTCMSINHMKMAEHGPVHQIPGPAGWLQVVHGGNVSNKIRGRRVSGAVARGQFPDRVLGPLREDSAARIRFENTVLTPLRDARDAAIALLRGQPKMSR
jgi:Putative rhamnosyl transferase